MFAWTLALSIVSSVSAVPTLRSTPRPRGKLHYGKVSFTCPADFPYAVFSSYYTIRPGQQPQPIILSPETSQPYPFSTTDPDDIPLQNLVDPVLYPASDKKSADTVITSTSAALNAILAIIDSQPSENADANCTKCLEALQVAQRLARTTPSDVPRLLHELCVRFQFKTLEACKTEYSPEGSGAIITQVLSYSNVSDRDGLYICHNWINGVCPQPAPLNIDVSKYFDDKPSPPRQLVPKASGKRIKVLHVSDFHLDPRYKNGAEADCTNASMCCRSDSFNAASPDRVVAPSNKYGAFTCDTPYELALAALQAIPAVAARHAEKPDFAFTIYTGDLVSHDPDNALSREYVEEVETVMYRLFRRFFGGGPVYTALGNHCAYQVGQDAPNGLPGDMAAKEFSWNYKHVSRLWHEQGWIDETVASTAEAHYGAYSVKVPGHNLRVITLNTDFWYQTNYYNYINMTDPDVSGSLRFLSDELTKAERLGERVWIVGHIPTGWSGEGVLPDPINLFYAIVDRFAPATIANIFWGHTHEDQFNIFYSGNGTIQSLETAIATAWIGPSITPLRTLNSGFRVYEVDTGDYNVYEAFTYYANVSTFADQVTYEFEYSTRQAYDPDSTWPKDAPLNATFWHAQTENMLHDTRLMQDFTRHQGRLSTQTQEHCVSQACREAKVCYMRSGSAALGQRCPQGYASVQVKKKK